MFAILVRKELQSILLSPKFAGSFAICSFLILLSVFIGLQEYRVLSRQYEAAASLNEQELREETSWMGLDTRAFRRPDPMQIFASGVQNDVGRYSMVGGFSPVKLIHSTYSDDSIFALFRMLDLVFIVQVVLSLFALLFTYDSVCGEKQDGTLRLVLANEVPRSVYLAAKGVGSWLALVIPLGIPVLLSVLLVVLFGVPMAAEHWVRLGMLLGASVLYFTFFIALGLFVSTLGRQPGHTFLGGLVVWILLVFILPRLGVMAASQLVSAPSVAEVEGQRDAFAQDRFALHVKDLEDRMQAREQSLERLSPEEREATRDSHQDSWMQEEEARRLEMRRAIDEYGRKLNEDARNRRMLQARVGFGLARISPAASYQLAAMNLADSDIAVKSRAEDAMLSFREAFLDFTQKKQAESGGRGGMRISFDSQRGVRVQPEKSGGALDLNGLPRFMPPVRNLTASVVSSLADFTWIAVAGLAAFAGGFVRFLRYDVR